MQDETKPLSAAAREVAKELMEGRFHSDPFVGMQQRAGIIDKAINATMRDLQDERDESARVSNKYQAINKKNWERAKKAEAEIKRLMEALDEIAEGDSNSIDSRETRIAKAAIAKTEKCPSCSDTGRVIIGPGDMTDPCECPLGQAIADTEGE